MVSAPIAAKDIFLAALDRQSFAERTAYLDSACGTDAELRHQVEVLLAAHDDPDSRLDQPPRVIESPLELTSATESLVRLGVQIGPYKLLQQIGEGGMGVVYMAEQRQPVERKVALKIIKPGMDSRQVIARFEAERQALALMDHPSIAKILDAGTVGDSKDEGGRMKDERQNVGISGSSFIPHPSSFASPGRPYFVMELVKGVPITKYCDERHLSLQQRLELLIPVCQAIQHAHQKGVIHRDIKPSNVLIAQYDGRPVPKVIDFGVAKATAQKLTERTMFTELGQVVGTLEYMSPEQAELNQLDIDTRSDVYSLGVLLYELLTGSTPFDKQKLRTAAFHEMLRIIREEEPPKPSTRLSTIETLVSVAANRSVEPARLGKSLRGELDWIVMKALEKDRNRRYETANGFAADIQRYLNDEPVQACPPSTTYRFRKFARKNRAALITSVVVATSLLIGIFVSVWQAIEANNARATANDRLILANDRLASEQKARQEAELAQKVANEERQRAERERVRAEGEMQRAEASFRKSVDAVDRLLNRVANSTLRNVPQSGEVRKQIMLDTVEFLEGLLKERPNDFDLRYRAASAFMSMSGGSVNIGGENLRLVERGHELLRKLHDEAPGNVRIREQLAGTYRALASRSDDPERTYRQAIELLRPIIHDSTIDQQMRLLYRFSLSRCYESMSGYLRSRGRMDEAERLLRDAIPLLRNDDGSIPDNSEIAYGARNRFVNPKECLARVYQSLGNLLDRAGRTQEAAEALQQAVQWAQAAYDLKPTDPSTRSVIANYCCTFGNFLLRTGRTDEASTYFRRAFPVLTDLLRDAPNDVYRTAVKNNSTTLIKAYQKLGNTDEVRKYLEQLDPQSAADLDLRGSLYVSLGDSQAALADFKRSDELEPHRWETFDQISALGKSVAGAASKLRPTDPAGAAAKRIQAEDLLWRGFRGMKNCENKLPEPGKRSLTEGLKRLVSFYMGSPGPGDESLARELQAECQSRFGVDDVKTAATSQWFAFRLSGMQQYVEAEPYFRLGVNWHEKHTPNSWELFYRVSNLGEFLLRAAGELRATDPATADAKLVEAEKLLLRGYRELKTHENDIPKEWKHCLTDGLRRLADFYTEMRKPDEAARWQTELDALPIDPSDVQSLVARASHYAKTDKLEQAIGDYSRAIEAKADRDQALHVARGDAYVRTKKYDLAIADYTAVIGPPHIHKRRGWAYFHVGQYEKSLADLTIPLDQGDLSTLRWIPLSIVAQCPDETFKTQFVALADRAVERSQQSSEARVARAIVRSRFGLALAPSDIEAVISTGDALTCNNLAWYLVTAAKERQPQKAVELAKRATTLAPKAYGYWNTLGTAEYRAGDWAAAIDHLMLNVKAKKSSEYDWLVLAMSHWQLGRQDEARTWLEKAASNKPKNPLDDLEQLYREAAELLGMPPP